MNKYLNYIDKFSETKILVIGDLMIDRFVYGEVSRISPEAPVPVVEVQRETDLPGGAGNVASNISSLGAKVYIASILGDDELGKKLKVSLNQKKVDTSGIFLDKKRPTTAKTRVIAQHQQVVRFDIENKDEINSVLASNLIEYLSNTISKMDTVVISDYGKGVITPKIFVSVKNFCKKNNIPLTVDPKVEHFLMYKNVSCITPNLTEALLGMRIHYKITNKDEEKIIYLGQKILNKLKCHSLIITRGEKGMSVFEKNKKPVNIPTRAKEVFDVTGAGDTVIAVLSLCIASGTSILVGAQIANYAAGIVVGKLGTATVSSIELKKSIIGGKS